MKKLTFIFQDTFILQKTMQHDIDAEKWQGNEDVRQPSRFLPVVSL